MRKPSRIALTQAMALAAWANSPTLQAMAGDYRDQRLDADETNMLALALEDMRARVYETDYPELRARRYLPVAGDVDPGAETFAYEETDEVGSAKVITNYAADLPSVETKSTKVTHGIVSLGDSYAYSIMDIRRAGFSGRPLQARKATAARRIFERGLDQIAAFGSPADGITDGICNRALGTSAGQLRYTAMTSAAWDSSPDAATMIADANKAVAEFISDSAETRSPTVMILPTLQFLRFSQTYTTDGAPEPALQRFLKSNGFVREVYPWDLLKSIDGSGGNYSRGLLMSKDPDVLELVIPQEFEVLPPQPVNLAVKVPAWGRTAGTCIYRPLGLRYMTALPDT